MKAPTCLLLLVRQPGVKDNKITPGKTLLLLCEKNYYFFVNNITTLRICNKITPGKTLLLLCEKHYYFFANNITTLRIIDRQVTQKPWTTP